MNLIVDGENSLITVEALTKARSTLEVFVI
jgi:hypothetical protein